jgi:recombination protein RecT
VQSVELGLEPGSAIGEGYLVPFKDQCTFIPGYRGLISLAFRSGHVKSVSAFCVYQGDHFEFELGLEPKIKHIPKMDAERDVKDITFAYAIVELKDGGRVYDVMSRGEVDKIRARSKASQNGPWVTDFAEMARKTVTRRCLKYAPMSVEMSKALSLEDSIDTGTNYMDAEFTSLDFEAVERSTKTETIKDKIPDAPNANPETGEVIDEPQETLI